MTGKVGEDWWSKPLRRPRALKVGDTLAVVSPSWGGPATFPKRYEAGKRYIEDSFGLRVIEMPNAMRPAEWLDQNPAARADDLHLAFCDPAIAGIVATIGGDDAIRLIPHLDLNVMRSNPKILLGYSDTTALHFACLKAGIGSLHGPSVMSGFAENGGMSATSRDSFYRAAFDPAPCGDLMVASEGWTSEHLDWSDPTNQQRLRARKPSRGLRCLRGAGAVTGRLIGGCGDVLEMVKGTSWWPPLDYWDGAVLFYETSEEMPHEGLILRWMHNLGAQGILSRISGVLLGRPGGQMSDAQKLAQEASILRALDELGLDSLPVIADLDIGHTDPILTLPYGVMTKIECDPPRVRILEGAVCAL
jgi:muramoyltetrapeptide carboxypeptidase LdcA involved in peptidoglycan recycling